MKTQVYNYFGAGNPDAKGAGVGQLKTRASTAQALLAIISSWVA